MSNVIEHIPRQYRDTFVQLLQEQDSALLEQLRAQTKPTVGQRDSVVDIFGTAVMQNLNEDDAPTEFGVQVDDTLGAFLKLFPGENLDEA